MSKHIKLVHSVTELLMLGSLAGSAAMMGPDAMLAHADSAGTDAMTYVVSGSKGAGVAVNDQATTAGPSALARAKQALDDPAKVGDSIDTKQSVADYIQAARKSVDAYAKKATNYIQDQNLSDSAKDQLKTQVKNLVTATDANLDQATTIDQAKTAINAGTYGLLTTAAATTVNKGQDTASAAQTAEKQAGDNTVAELVTPKNQPSQNVLNTAQADHSQQATMGQDQSATDKSDLDFLNGFSTIFKDLFDPNVSDTQLNQDLDKLGQKADQVTGQSNSTDQKTGSSSASAGSNAGTTNDGQAATGQSKANGTTTTTDKQADQKKGVILADTDQLLVQIKEQGAQSVVGDQVVAKVHTPVTSEANGQKVTVFNDGQHQGDDWQFAYWGDKAYNNVKDGDTVIVTINSVSTYNDTNFGQAYDIDYSGLQVQKKDQANNPTGSAATNGQSGQAGTQGNNSQGTPAGQPAAATNNNAPTGSTLPQTSHARLNAVLSMLGLTGIAGALVAALRFGRREH